MTEFQGLVIEYLIDAENWGRGPIPQEAISFCVRDYRYKYYDKNITYIPKLFEIMRSLGILYRYIQKNPDYKIESGHPIYKYLWKVNRNHPQVKKVLQDAYELRKKYLKY